MKFLSRETRTLVFFESSHRIAATINDMSDILGPDRLAAICRELTKKFETVLRAPIAELKEIIAADKNQTRGEFVIVIAGYSGDESEALSNAYHMSTALLEYMPASQAARIAAKLNTVSRREVYRMLDTKLRD